MKRFLLSAAALVVFASPAAAADLQAKPYTKAPPAPPPVPTIIYNWTGFYIGGHVGGDFAGNNSLSGNGGRFLGGVQGGFDYQFAPNWVTGIEAEYSWMTRNNNGVTFPGGVVVTDRDNQLGSVTGRVGYTWGPGMIYVTGGGALTGVQATGGATLISGETATLSNSTTLSGWVVGAGYEYMIAPNWAVRGEYLYYGFSGNNTTTPTLTFPIAGVTVAGNTGKLNTSVVRIGVDYKFDWLH